jgi:hypothetical protein
MAQNVSKSFLRQNERIKFIKKYPKIWFIFVIFKQTAQSKQLLHRRKIAPSGHPGHHLMAALVSV